MSVPNDVYRADALCASPFISAARARHAAEVLAGHAKDATELRDWLEYLGLVDPVPPLRPRGKKGQPGRAA